MLEAEGKAGGAGAGRGREGVGRTHRWAAGQRDVLLSDLGVGLQAARVTRHAPRTRAVLLPACTQVLGLRVSGSRL